MIGITPGRLTAMPVTLQSKKKEKAGVVEGAAERILNIRITHASNSEVISHSTLCQPRARFSVSSRFDPTLDWLYDFSERQALSRFNESMTA